MSNAAPHALIIGAGIGGLASALRLAHAGLRVTVVDRLEAPGGKMRCVPSDAGPVDAGPTILTMKPVFDALFEETGSPLSRHVTLHPEPLLARHFWRDGTCLDLMANPEQSEHNVAHAFGIKAANEFKTFCQKARDLFDGFEGPVMRSAKPSNRAIAKALIRAPSLAVKMAPHRSLLGMLNAHFSEPRLAQLFARYATYVGGLPQASPALLSLIWHAETQGVWYVEGGMHKLAQAIAGRAAALGAEFHFGTHVSRIEVQNGKACAAHTPNGRIAADLILFNGDPRALHSGAMGKAMRRAVPAPAVTPRSLSAAVHAFAADVGGFPLAGHNVFFGDAPMGEFAPLSKGQMPQDPSLYICAQDRFGGQTPNGAERFEIIMNAPPCADRATPSQKEQEQCQTQIFARLKDFGLRFSPQPGPTALTLPQDFARLFPQSNGALYGRSPHGMMAAFKRPQTRSQIPGLYLVGGGVHPGAGVPMVTLCAQHAAATIMQDLGLTSTSRPAATLGGMSTV